jgi:MFS superfamily sulfate permease-like transporter
VGQLGKVLGLSLEKGSILQTFRSILENLDQVNLATTAIAAVTLAIMILLPRVTKRVPAALVAVAFGILLSAAVDLTSLGVTLVGPIPSGLPSLSIPDLGLISALWPSALGIALMSFVESNAAGRAFLRRGETGPNANQELVALGFANIGGGISQSMPAGGGTSQTAVNDQAGAKSQISGVVTAGVVAVTLLFLAPLISLMPEATLGALVLIAAAGLIKVDEFRRIRAVRYIEFRWAVVAFFGVIILGTLEGILLAVLISLAALLHSAEHPPVYLLGRKPGTNVFRPLAEQPNDETFDGLLILKSEGLLFFANIQSFLEQVDAFIHLEQPHVLLLDASTIPAITYTALKQLREFDEKLQDADITFWIASLTADTFHILERTSLGRNMGHERLFLDLEIAVSSYLQLEGNTPAQSMENK